MKKVLSTATKRHVLIGVVIALIAGAASYSFFAEAVTVQTVGGITVELAPNAGDAGTEFVQLEYSGFGEADLEGWSIHNSTGQVYDLSGIYVKSTETVRICEEGASDTLCVAHWTGTDVFDDEGDVMILINDYGTEAARISYSTSDNATLLSEFADYVAEVHGKKGKIPLCHAEQNKDGYRQQDASVNALVQSIEKDNNNHPDHPGDVIPNFFYDVGSGIGYFQGLNWPEQRSLLEGGCQ